MGYMLETLPIAPPSAKARKRVDKVVADVAKKTVVMHEAQIAVGDWLRHQFQIVKLGRLLANVSATDSDGFVEAVKAAVPRKRKLTAGDIAELKREFGTTIEPARKCRAAVLILEEELSGLVNEAYGLTAADERLMWATAPVRMPFTPKGFEVPEAVEDEEVDGSED